MSHELLLLRALIVSPEASLRELFGEAAGASPVPLEMIEAADAAAACEALTENVALVYLDDALSPADAAAVAAAARSAPGKPFTIQLATATGSMAFVSEALAGKPSRLDEARHLLARSLRIKLPSRALVVDDSPTMRSIVRKTLSATRFPFEVTEAGEGFAALELVRAGDVEVVFLDYNLPEFSGLETLSEFRREGRSVSVVMISSTQDTAVADQARELGAAFLKKPFFPADVETALCGFYGLRALNPKRL